MGSSASIVACRKAKLLPRLFSTAIGATQIITEALAKAGELVAGDVGITC